MSPEEWLFVRMVAYGGNPSLRLSGFVPGIRRNCPLMGLGFIKDFVRILTAAARFVCQEKLNGTFLEMATLPLQSSMQPWPRFRSPYSLLETESLFKYNIPWTLVTCQVFYSHITIWTELISCKWQILLRSSAKLPPSGSRVVTLLPTYLLY